MAEWYQNIFEYWDFLQSCIFLFFACSTLHQIEFYSMGVLLRSIEILFLLIGFIYLFFSSNFSKIYGKNLSNSSMQMLKWEEKQRHFGEKRYP